MVRAACAAMLTFAMAVITPPPAAAQDPVWGDVVLAGGVRAARQAFLLGEPEGRFDAALGVDFVRRYARSGDWSQLASRLARFDGMFNAIRAVVARRPDGIRVPAPGAPRDDVDELRAFADALGLDVRTVNGRLRVSPGDSPQARERAEWAADAEIDTANVAERLNNGEAVTVEVPVVRLPLPLPGAWPAAGKGQVLSLPDVLRDRRDALFYAGLLSIDSDSLAALASQKDLVQRLHGQAPALAAFGRSLAIRDGTVAVPGGGPAWPAWQALAAKSPGKAGEFLPALLSVDGGDLAYFFDAVAHATPATRSAIVDLSIADASSLSRIYRDFRRAISSWALEARPFDRSNADPAWALALIDMHGPVVPGPAWLPVALERAVEGASWPATEQALPETVPPGNVEWLAHWLFARETEPVARARLLRFSARLRNLESANAFDVEDALRTFRDMPALALTVERLGVDDAAAIAHVGRAAYALSRAGGRDTVEPVLARWQSALALLEQVSRVRPVPEVDALVRTLADAAARPLPEVTEGVLHWVTDDLEPALAASAAGAPLETATLVKAIFGDRPRAGLRVTLDGLPYDRNPLRVAHRDIDQLLPPDSSMSDHGRTFAAIRRQAGREMRTAADARDVAAELFRLRGEIPPSSPDTPPDRLKRALEKAEKALEAWAFRSGQAPSAALEVPEVGEAVGVAADILIQPVVYALAMTPLHQNAALQSEAWSFHAIAQDKSKSDDWWKDAWQPAAMQARAGGGAALVGSWLSLDLALADAIVPRRFDQGGLLALPVKSAILANVALRVLPPGTRPLVSDDEVQRLAEGRAVVAAWAGQTPTADARHALDHVALGSTRRNLATWTLERDPAAAGAGLTTDEVAQLAGRSGAVVSAIQLDGCLCLVPRPLMPPDDARSTWMLGVPAVLGDDAALRLAEGLHAMGQPEVLVNDLLPLVTADWLARIEPYASDDWESLTLWTKRMTQGEIESYVLQLVAQGILVPADEVVP